MQNFNKKIPTKQFQQPGMFVRVYKSALRNLYFEVCISKLSLPKIVIDYELLVLAGALVYFANLIFFNIKYTTVKDFGASCKACGFYNTFSLKNYSHNN